MQNAECRVQSAECRVQSAEFSGSHRWGGPLSAPVPYDMTKKAAPGWVPPCEWVEDQSSAMRSKIRWTEPSEIRPSPPRTTP